jgi:glycosyltransferase involved in cell wall biosynthesis
MNRKALSMPLVSVVIPTYNRSADLKRALVSVMNQTLSDIEVLVVDNHSQDDTDVMIKSLNDRRIRLLKVNNHGIIAVSRNLGAFSAAGKYLAFLDSDDWWVPSKLFEAISELEEGADLVYHPLWIVKREKQRKFRQFVGTSYGNGTPFEALLLNGNSIPCSSVVVRSDLFIKVGGFSEEPDLVSVEDFDCWLRISKISKRFIFISSVLGYYWQGINNTSGNPNLKITSNLRLKEIYLDDFFVEKSKQELPFWFYYNLGFSYYKLHEKKKARYYFSRVLFRSSSIESKLKLWWCLIMSFLPSKSYEVLR